MRGGEDRRLEAAIEAKRRELVAATSSEKKRQAWYAMKALIESRTAGQVWRMERQRGLRPAGDA